MSDRKKLSADGWFVLVVSTAVAVALFVMLALEQDKLNRRIAALECRAGDVEKCGPPWNSRK